MSNTKEQLDDTVAEEEAEISMIVALGFTTAQTKQALKANGGNVDRALEALFRDKKARSKGERVKESDDIEQGNRKYVTPSLGMMVLSDVRYKTDPGDLVSQESDGDRPGAVAVLGIRASVEEESVFTEGIQDSSITAMITSIPIAAELPNRDEEHDAWIEDQLRKHDTQLRKVIAERENAVVAQVIDTSKGHEGMCSQRVKWMTAIACLVLIAVGVSVGVVLRKSKKSRQPAHRHLRIWSICCLLNHLMVEKHFKLHRLHNTRPCCGLRAISILTTTAIKRRFNAMFLPPYTSVQMDLLGKNRPIGCVMKMNAAGIVRQASSYFREIVVSLCGF